MCGIAGFWYDKPINNLDEETIESMLLEIKHRGPDHQNYHLDKNNSLIMGHTRLSIIDLNTGNQPLYSHDNSLVLTVNGEFYDYKRIRAELMSEGFEFKTKSDSEIALHLYEKKGLDFVHDLRGEFAFTLYDSKKDTFIMVRDRFGIRPIFYTIQGNNLYYGSEVKSILRHPDVPRELDDKALVNQLMQVMVPGTSLYKNIHAIKPGYMLIIKRENGKLNIKEHCYWDAKFPELDEEKVQKTEEEWVQAVRSSLIEAVQLRFEADVPVGCYLSGGIDSCSALGLATGVQQSPVKAFTISFDHDDYDEAAIAIEMANKCNAEQEILKVDANKLYGEYYIKALWHSERTFYNTLGIAKWHMSHRVNECGYKVVVTGEGSDELFSGYPFFKRDYFLHGISPDESKILQEQLANSNKVFQGAILAEKDVQHPAFQDLIGFTPSWIQPWILSLESMKELFSDKFKDILSDYDPIAAIAETLKPEMLKNRHPLDQVQYTWIKTMLEGQILNWGGDRVDMANAMESRPPFLDHHLAELAFTIPQNLRIKGNIEKWVLREAMKGILPEVLYKREKFAFMAPPSHTDEDKSRSLQVLLDHYMSDSNINDLGVISIDKYHEFIDTYSKDTDSTIMVRKDAMLNHILGVHVLNDLFIHDNPVPDFKK